MTTATKPKPKAPRLPVASEAQEQRCLIEWARLASCSDPRLKMLVMIPNGAARATNARHLVAQGLAAGLPDLALLVPSGKRHGLFIELKRRTGGKLAPEQREWIQRLRAQGYAAECCKGWEDARQAIVDYLAADGGAWSELPLKGEHSDLALPGLTPKEWRDGGKCNPLLKTPS